MAEEAKKEDEAGGKSKLPMKLIIIVGAVMLVEGAVLGGLWMMFGQPQQAEAQELQEDTLSEQEELVEVLLIGDKFQNTRLGSQSFLYDTTIYVLVKRKNQAYVEERIESNINRLKEDITQIFARAEPAHLNEPELQTLKRHILAACEVHFKEDAEHDPYIEKVIISDWKRFSTDL